MSGIRQIRFLQELAAQLQVLCDSLVKKVWTALMTKLDSGTARKAAKRRRGFHKLRACGVVTHTPSQGDVGFVA